jgi:glyoxylase-like metal-dependent hydrolase (beta-lactamase superfamily II)
MSTGVYEFKIGNFDCCVISDGSREAKASETFMFVAEEELNNALKEVGYPDQEYISGFNVLYVNTGEKKLLVDAGLGTGSLIENFRAAGYSPEEVDLIAITHGDSDHVGGILNDAGEPNFPNARYVMWAEAWDKWTDDEKRQGMLDEIILLFRGREGVTEEQLAQAAKNRTKYGTETLPKIKDQVDFIEPGVEFLPGIKFVEAPGHRSDQVAVSISSAGEQLLHVADSIKHPVQALHQDWYGGIDSYPEIIINTNKKLFALIAETNATFFCTHLEFPGLAHLNSEGQMILIDG